ncbi:type I-F CRISPR-associated protein Csy1 [Moraxella sp. ZY210820]|uniref:type I-F CRISPR-associated protein Csy1 n=1 Tax=unclassified Moraxella TaxID=2685852 RepID=UPI002730786C|nr:type I-F CRISPR-associated protein Csy1 [Moraxella sp. ZY210820]WLF83390.1 type I-F CRISPR-associated protein Csy1 [Moraxella sp. ZY210820]
MSENKEILLAQQAVKDFLNERMEKELRKQPDKKKFKGRLNSSEEIAISTQLNGYELVHSNNKLAPKKVDELLEWFAELKLDLDSKWTLWRVPYNSNSNIVQYKNNNACNLIFENEQDLENSFDKDYFWILYEHIAFLNIENNKKSKPKKPKVYFIDNELMKQKLKGKPKKSKKADTAGDDNESMQKYEPKNWFNYVAENIEKVFLNVSHIAKLTHSSSQAVNIKDSILQTEHLHLISTQTANANMLDRGYADAKFAPIAEFLTYPVENTNKQLGEILRENEQGFAKISDSQAERQAWCDAIKGAYVAQKLSSHTLAKQIYVPVSDDCEYHLLSPMYSSSLAQHIFETIKHAHDKDNPAKIAKQKGEYHQDESIYFADIATLATTKSNHQNVSFLNNQRSGQLYLFCAKPPKIRHNPNPPKSVNELLNVCYSDCKDELFEIKKLLSVTENKALFLNDDRKNALIEHIQNIGDTIITQMLVIYQNQANGWTNNVNIPTYLKLFLDKAISEQWILSQPELMSELTQLAEEISAWISTQTHKNRVAKLEKIYAKILLPLLQSHYWVLKA